jgi:cytochrome c biogenesis protein CcmG/thiol:disulfide interchange protein DsbE
MRLRFLLPLVVFVALAGMFGYLLATGNDPSRIPSVLIDKPAPAFALPALDDGQPGVSNADLKGTVTVLNFFASSCVPCRAEHPLVSRLAEEGVKVYGINYKDDPAKARVWLQKMGNPYAAVGTDTNGRVAIDWGVYGIPETFVLDADGRIRYKQVGPMMPYDFDNVILPIVRKLGS